MRRRGSGSARLAVQRPVINKQDVEHTQHLYHCLWRSRKYSASHAYHVARCPLYIGVEWLKR
jgi:hypothetical protein